VKKSKDIKKEKKEKDTQIAERIPLIIMKAIGRAALTVFNVILTVGLIGVIAAAIIGCAFLIYISNNVDMSVDDIIISTQDNELATRLYYYDDEGNLVENTEQNISSGSGATWVEYEDIPTYLRDAFIAIEDKRFWDHNGVDWITTAQATIVFFVPIGNGRGGSTLTQQLVKNLTGDKD
jgi:penicillin-binding protein 1A